jgi:hypothetical protein
MSGILGSANKVLIDESAKGVVPYLPLPQLKTNDSRSVTVTEQPMATAQPTPAGTAP